MKKCSVCGIEKNIIDFPKKGAWCKGCVSIYKAKNYQDNKVKILEKSKQYAITHKEEKKKYNQQYYQNNKEEIKINVKIYKEKNKEEIKIKDKIYRELHKQQISATKSKYYQNNREHLLLYAKNRYQIKRIELIQYQISYSLIQYKTNIFYRIKKIISKSIHRHLKTMGFSKIGEPTIKHLSYTIKELKDHIESYFALPDNEWMNWDNWGVYDAKTWNDNDKSTWKWQLDHIQPHSTYYYTSMEDQSFKDCWALSNLRPLSAKQNFYDGVRRIRH